MTSTPTFAYQAASPLSSKVTTVISSSYADTEFREALALLDERGILNTAETRRQLRLDLQKEVIDSNGEIIDEFAKVAEQLRRIGTTIGRLNESFNEMKTQIDVAHKATSSALTEASQLMAQRRQIEQKQTLLNAFNANFVLSEDDTAALTLSSEPVDDLFFATLSKAKKISRDCEILLGFENQTLGLEIMEQTSKNLNLGFQKLYKWVQREFKTLNLENPQISSSIRRALRVLAERPSLFQNCLDFFAEAREQVLGNSFYTALTGSSPSGVEDATAKPIELVAHDPLRYVGDMLAWTHSAAVGEREALEGLFIAEGEDIAKGIQAGRENEVWRLAAEDGEYADEFDAVKTLNELVDRDMSGAARILRQRVEQVIQTNEETILAYKLAKLLNFYKSTFSKLLSPGSSLVELLGVLESEALRQFRSLTRDHVAAIQGDFQHTPVDLRPPEFLNDALEQLEAIMKTYETSFTSSGDPEEEFEPVLTEAFDPFISGSANMAETLHPPSNSIFLINCLILARSSFSRFDFTQRRVAELQAQIDQERARLVETQYHLIASLKPLGESREDVEKVSSLEIVQPAALTQASQTLDDFLPSALMDAMERLKNLQDSGLAQAITEEAAEKFCVDFEHVEEMLMLADEMTEQQQSESDDFQSLRALFPRTSGEIRKTYDESYLTCSTAVYYEAQGNEGEAMRCWKQALERIYDHNANRVFPNFTPRSDTEKALVESLRQLELQCKERIDLLEALRLSRHESRQNDLSSSQSEPIKPTLETQNVGPARQHEQGWIGNGTIPAVTYTELARPDMLRRRSTPRTPSSKKVVGGNTGAQACDAVPPLLSRNSPVSMPLSRSPEKTSRTSSPERHTMRTTLRTSRPAERLTKTPLWRPAPKRSDGPGANKAAILAWSSLGQRDPADPGLLGAQEPPSNLPTPSEQLHRRPGQVHKIWDSNSRRLTSPLTRSPAKQPDRRVSADLADLRQADGYPYLQPSPISVSAASSALNALVLRDNSERHSPARERIASRRTTPPQTPQTSKLKNLSDTDAGLSEAGKSRFTEKNTASDPAMSSRRSASERLSARKTKGATSTTEGGSGTNETRSGLASPPSADISLSFNTTARPSRRQGSSGRQTGASLVIDSQAESSDSSTSIEDEQISPAHLWKKRKADLLMKIPPGVEPQAAKQILNEIIVQGDEVHWSDIAGLEVAKNALRETVVYPFLRPDLFMGLREPAKGMLLFGPPGTGKTMLARAVATESKSTFFSISASSLVSKYLGDSEKLVRALFALAKMLAPSIIFVDEIDSLLSQRSGSGEHESMRRIKTEFLIQWSDLQRAAAGREVSEKDKERGDPNRVLVLAATNLPWAIDEAARRRFVRRQYISLPEAETRAIQLKALLKQQKHTLDDADIDKLVGLTDGFSGSDITALAKDAAMGPLRSLGDALLHTTIDQIRAIELSDFVASLNTIRRSVSKSSLAKYEEWAKEFGERGG
ncbi:oligomeric complex COG6-domain-containing protein [Achaetomium macrosporum]|uniref:Conserved oligomeric Golgi complex subunit 6 n=1 Tax=Achaetomium macrosporum TaxID=79813 RepID=A0AAN7HDA2_9PEZI|nr:oligomeric complex COG6-domain-containing protein [Achaetomium macrosporum]